MKPGTKQAYRNATSGFTMIEIAIALGVIGFALVAIIGILPAGLEVQRDNRSETIINQDATFWMDAIRSGAQGIDDLTNWVDSISLPDAPAYSFGGGGIANGKFSSGANIISLLTTAIRFHETNATQLTVVNAIVTALSGSAAEKDDRNNRDLSFKYRLSVEITNAAPLVVGFDELNPQNPPVPAPLGSLYEIRLTLSYPYTGRDSEPRSRFYRSTVSRDKLTEVIGGREYYLFTP